MLKHVLISLILTPVLSVPIARAQDDDDQSEEVTAPVKKRPVRKKSAGRNQREAGKFNAQPLTFLFKDNSVYGFELGGSIIVSRIQDQSARLNSVSAGLLVDHETLLGVTFVNQTGWSEHSRDFAVSKSQLSYVGFESTSISGWDWVANTRTSVMLGRGTLQTETEVGKSNKAAVWIAEPKTGAYFNITSFLRLGFDVSYRFVAVDAKEHRGESWSGFSYGVALRGGLL